MTITNHGSVIPSASSFFVMPKRSKEWWLERADREDEYAVGAGAPAATPEPETLCECGFPYREHRIGYSRSRCTFQPAAPTGEEAETLRPGAVLAHLHALWTYAERGDKEKWSERAATLSKAIAAQATELAALRRQLDEQIADKHRILREYEAECQRLRATRASRSS